MSKEQTDKRQTNREFKKVLEDLCNEYELPGAFWATKRQASKYRNHKGRLYQAIKNKQRRIG